MPVKPTTTEGSGPARPQDDLQARLARIEGQVRGVSRMLEEKRYCIDILTQMAAVHEGLRAVSRQIVENHMQSCVAGAMRSGDPAEASRVSREMSDLLDRFTR
ncbi:MAG: hypothetical protein FD129_936 [bacterium]|nr:MAG: hypothetical protein FD129_936 [bacterium]